MELCSLNLLILIDFFLSNSYLCVLFESLSQVINQESCLFVKFGENLPRSFFEILKYIPRFTWGISKFQKSELSKFIPNFPLKHVITSTNFLKTEILTFKKRFIKRIAYLFFF